MTKLKAYKEKNTPWWLFPISVVLFFPVLLSFMVFYSLFLALIPVIGSILVFIAVLVSVFYLEQHIHNTLFKTDLGNVEHSKFKITFSKSEEVINLRGAHKLRIHFRETKTSMFDRFLFTFRKSVFGKRRSPKFYRKFEYHNFIEATGVRYNIQVFGENEKAAFIELIQKIKDDYPDTEVLYAKR